jgi:hypothetical protein
MTAGSSFTDTLKVKISSCRSGGAFGSYTLYWNGPNGNLTTAMWRIACEEAGMVFPGSAPAATPGS